MFPELPTLMQLLLGSVPSTGVVVLGSCGDCDCLEGKENDCTSVVVAGNSESITKIVTRNEDITADNDEGDATSSGDGDSDRTPG